MERFFDFTIGPSDALGYGLFSPPHLAMILLSAALVGLLCALERAGKRRLSKGAAWAALSLELLRALLLALKGAYGIGRLPLHLCGMAVFLCLLHALRGGETLGQFLYGLCMPGAAAAILFPDWRCNPPLHFMNLCGYGLHALLTAYPLLLIAEGRLRPDWRALPKSLGLLLALALPVYGFDKFFHVNYMFLNWPPEGTPLAWFSFLGRPGYLLGMLPLLCPLWPLLYAPFWAKKGRTGRPIRQNRVVG